METVRAWDRIAVAARMQAEIKWDVLAGLVPRSVRSYSQLHDFVDANGYGGYFDEDSPDLTESDWALAERNAAADAVDAWLKGGMRATA